MAKKTVTKSEKDAARAEFIAYFGFEPIPGARASDMRTQIANDKYNKANQ